jgi:hypothetical protein
LNAPHTLSSLRRRKRFPSNFYKKYYPMPLSFTISIKTANYIETSTLLKKNFETFFYHVKSDPNPARAADISKKNIQPILFFSKTLTNAEKHYWPTELEMTGIIWAIKKMRNIIKSSTKSIIFYINHSAVIDIVKIISLTSSNIDKLNNRFIRANQYLSQFQLDVRY